MKRQALEAQHDGDSQRREPRAHEGGTHARSPRLPTISKPLPEPWFRRLDDGVVEMRWDSVDHAYLTPTERFFVRNQGETPHIHAGRWRLVVGGPGVDRELVLTYDDVVRMASVRVVRAIECAGNGRHFFEGPDGSRPDGSRWLLGGIGVAEWTGVSLAEVLERARLRPSAVEVLPVGLDRLRVRRPLPIGKALEEDTLLAVAMNGEALPPDHGFPVRLVVSGWVGIASIKWLGSLRVTDRPVMTPWNVETYVLRERGAPNGGVPLAEQGVKSAIQLPWPARLEAVPQLILGRSWSGCGRIAHVDVSVDGGAWRSAQLIAPNHTRAWVRWGFGWNPRPGRHDLRVRAIDEHGNAQPDRVPWNELGYAYDGVVGHPVEVSGRPGPRGKQYR